MTRHMRVTLPRRLSAIAAIVPATVVLHASTALAAGQLVEVAGEFSPGESDADITLDYVVTAAEDAVDTIALTALHFGGATLDGLEAVTSDGTAMTVSADVGTDKTTVELTPPAPIEPGEELQFTVSYQAVQAVSAHGSDADLIEIPVLAVTWAPAESRSGVFTGRLTLPAGYHFAEGFPSVPESVDQVGSSEVVTYDMIVMPAVIRAVATASPPPFFTFQHTLEIVALSTVLAAVAALYYGTVLRPRRERAGQPVAEQVHA